MLGLENLFAWVPWLVEWLLFPRWSECYTDNIKRKVIDLPKQVLTTKDGKRVRVGGVFVYHIRDIEKWIIENEDPESGVLIEAERVVREWVRHHDFQEVQDYDPKKREEGRARLRLRSLGPGPGLQRLR